MDTAKKHYMRGYYTVRSLSDYEKSMARLFNLPKNYSQEDFLQAYDSILITEGDFNIAMTVVSCSLKKPTSDVFDEYNRQ